MMAIDIGGTWTRFRLGNDIWQRPTPSVVRRPHVAAEDLLTELIELITEQVPQAASACAISLGAALDEVTGTVYGSGPLWGGQVPGDFVEPLRRRRPDVSWEIYNDVTSALVDYAASVRRERDVRWIGYLTVSSGIAAKTFDATSGQIVVDADGQHGEVGHLPARIPEQLAGASLRCDCGEYGHVSAVAAGPAIQRVATYLGVPDYDDAWFAQALNRGEPQARELLEVVTRPVADVLRSMWTTMPWLDVVGLGGGVISGLGRHYLDRILSEVASASGYAANGSPEQWKARIEIAANVDPSRGAALLASGAAQVVSSKHGRSIG